MNEKEEEGEEEEEEKEKEKKEFLFVVWRRLYLGIGEEKKKRFM